MSANMKGLHMVPQRVIGIIMIIAGVVLFIMGMNAKDSVADRFSEFFTGRFTDATTWYLVGGIALAVGGLVVASVSGRRR